MNAEIIIVESGATKSEWRVFDEAGREVKRFARSGTNVSAMKIEDVRQTLCDAIESEGLTGARRFHLYTAGVVTADISRELEESLRQVSAIRKIEIQNDLMGAARGVCGHSAGIVAILGTGSNTCFFDGESVSQKVFSGGYILGDEGSGASLGKLFLADYIKGLVPEEIASDFASEFDASYAGIVSNVYHSPSPSGFLGSLAPFLLRHYPHPYAKKLIEQNFRSFIERALLRYDVEHHPVGIVGGMGWAFQDIIRPLMEAAGIRISQFLKAPIDGLCNYHLEKQ